MSVTPDSPTAPVPEHHGPTDLGGPSTQTATSTFTPTLDAPAPSPQPAADDRPTGPLAAAILAAGIACAVFGLSIIATEAFAAVEKAMTLSQPVGTLSGKAVTATVAYAVAWVILHFVLRHRRPDLGRVMWTTAGLTIIGLLGTFPPFYLFVSGH